MAEFVPQTIAELQRNFAEGLSPVTVVETCLARMGKSDSLYNAMIFVGRQQALEDARQAEAELRAGKRRGSLHGVPVAVKDVDGDERADVVAASGENLEGFPALPSRVLVYLDQTVLGGGSTPAADQTLNPFASAELDRGVFVG